VRPMRIEVWEEPAAALAEYSLVPIAFQVRHVFDISERGDGGDTWVLTERDLDAPYLKDYDADPGEAPLEWGRHFDLSKWAFFAAYIEDQRVGGAAAAFDAADLDVLEGRRDVGLLWDLRVIPEMRGRGVGTALFHAAEAWMAARGARWLKVETQNINVAACRFYQRQGCVLGGVHRFAYPEFPDEIQLLWYKELLPSQEVD
jgi:GNAT superfamily N-acetyltransferase